METGERFPEQYLLPVSVVSRVMKGHFVRQDLKAGAESVELMRHVLTEFLCFVASEATARARKDKSRKTLQAEDVLFALKRLGFGDYGELLAAFLDKSRREAAAEAEGVEVSSRDGEGEDEGGERDGVGSWNGRLSEPLAALADSQGRASNLNGEGGHVQSAEVEQVVVID
uniref:Transcription factor CBF/NF-Y/archaeal histone domain-containing protein n=1 Tax=Chromera velia CCMP2878 TaxID=1169474 RepID=A0A0G4HK92_9ALVE|eukprot:Cvel_7252.t1-p1 / transcript=Cvel_7252.t1 / gene=Cvel_7252 / organism=Chromera_velia_CCMP2878 / gene_product=Nuclear transcription factor Y subunit beta, putative / transcript_product=Nuclear transcription factor Y subunit beta, putative / location=Cvel_scaffold374:52392-54718(-) / protein_length=170 / sequence_SO=supercontig / SO=protein_coding / is_pseudo=false